jgi:hypothetical protein
MAKDKRKVVCVIGKQQGIAWNTRKAEKGDRKKLLQKGLPRRVQEAGHPEEVYRLICLQEDPKS